MEDYRTIGAIAALVAAAATPLLLMRWREATASGEPDEALRPPSESERSKSKKRKPKKASGGGGGAHSTEEEDEAALSAGLPVLTVGQRSWHKVREEFVTVTKVHFDDPPPYYTVRTISGVELHTVRTRLETEEERAEAAAAEELRAEEARAEACAAALLAEEAQEAKTKRKPNSGREKQAKKRN